MNPAIFKSYDIRGLAPGEIDEKAARRIGKALAAIEKPSRVVVGHDMRGTSTALEEALVEGMLASGASVARVGLCSTPMFNFAIGEAAGAYDLGVMITASHNPAQYNGFKLTRRDNLPIGQGSGMEELRDLACSETPILESKERGSESRDEGLLDRYVDAIIGLAALPEALPELRLAIDAGNGMDGHVLPKLTKRLRNITSYSLFWELDGNFPNHEANPIKLETLEKLREKTVKNACLFGVAFDGDGDRVGFVDEQGTPIPGDLLTALFAREILREKGPGTVLYDLRSSWSVPEVVREAGGNPEMCRVGHAHIKRQMRDRSALFAGELSMHFYFADLWNCESGDLAMLLLLKLILREGKPLSAIWKPLQRYAHSGEINFEVTDAKAVLAALEEKYEPIAADVSRLDGLRLELRPYAKPEEDWWFSVRPSNTEPLLRLNLEARSTEQMERRKQELTAFIQDVG